jgi:AcrR family transcriptional regulator
MSSSPAVRSAYHHGDLRRSLVDAATTAAEELGADKVSVREVARRAGVSHAAAYHHFTDKNDLLRAVALEAFGELRSRMASASEASGLVEALAGAARAYLTFARERPAAFRFMWARELCMPDGMDDPLADAQRGLAADVDSVLEAHADELDRTGDPRLGMLATWSIVHGFATIAVDTPAFKHSPPAELDAIAGALIDTLVRGIGR